MSQRHLFLERKVGILSVFIASKIGKKLVNYEFLIDENGFPFWYLGPSIVGIGLALLQAPHLINNA